MNKENIKLLRAAISESTNFDGETYTSHLKSITGHALRLALELKGRDAIHGLTENSMEAWAVDESFAVSTNTEELAKNLELCHISLLSIVANWLGFPCQHTVAGTLIMENGLVKKSTALRQIDNILENGLNSRPVWVPINKWDC